MRRISRMLHAGDITLPDLGALERAGMIIMLPVGGGDVLAWATRMAALGLPEVHLLDREVPPATERHQKAVEIVNQRSNCRAFLTQKRALENYLHPRAVEEVSGLSITFGDDEDTADLVARRCYERVKDIASIYSTAACGDSRCSVTVSALSMGKASHRQTKRCWPS